MGGNYRVIKTNHDRDQKEEGKQLAPWYWEKGRVVVCRGMDERGAKEYAERLQRLRDTATKPFRFTTYTAELDYPQSPV